jgi:hypothetical protein
MGRPSCARTRARISEIRSRASAMRGAIEPVASSAIAKAGAVLTRGRREVLGAATAVGIKESLRITPCAGSPGFLTLLSKPSPSNPPNLFAILPPRVRTLRAAVEAFIQMIPAFAWSCACFGPIKRLPGLYLSPADPQHHHRKPSGGAAKDRPEVPPAGGEAATPAIFFCAPGL